MKKIKLLVVLFLLLTSCSTLKGRGLNSKPGYLKQSKRVIFAAVTENKKYNKPDSKNVHGKLLIDVSIDSILPKTVYITSVSPFKPENFTDVFNANACRFTGKANNVKEKSNTIFVEVDRFSCIDNMGNIYETELTNNEDGISAIITDKGADKGLTVTVDVKSNEYRLEAGKDVVIRFNKAVNDIPKVTRVSGIEIKSIHELIENIN